jgi:hypothetical protein
MKIAIMQPYFFPYIGYFQLINAVDKFVIYDDVNYINKGWINRNNLLVNGKAALYTVPLEGAGQNKKINELNVVKEDKWKIKLLRTIQQNYTKAPFFSAIYSLVEGELLKNEETISRLNFNCIRTVSNYLEIKTEFVASTTIYANASLKGQYRIIDICEKENAESYINPIGGVEIYTLDLFRQKKIGLSFLQPNLFEYKQYKNEFVPWLSMIDVMMFNSPDQIRSYLNNYQLITP